MQKFMRLSADPDAELRYTSIILYYIILYYIILYYIILYYIILYYIILYYIILYYIVLYYIILYYIILYYIILYYIILYYIILYYIILYYIILFSDSKTSKNKILESIASIILWCHSVFVIARIKTVCIYDYCCLSIDYFSQLIHPVHIVVNRWSNGKQWFNFLH